MARGDIFIVPPKVEHQVVRLEDAEIISCEFSFDHFFPPKENSAYQQVHEAALNLSFAWLFLKDADDIHSQFSLRPETGECVNTLMNAMLVEYSRLKRRCLFFAAISSNPRSAGIVCPQNLMS